jgi:glycosyltransferase involved in cell wall biosynthesis
MKILLTTDNIGGTWTFAVELARALREQKVDVILATMGWPLNAEQREDIAQIDHVELHESHYKPEWTEPPWTDVEQAGDWLRTLEQKTHPDVVHLTTYTLADQCWDSPVLITGLGCLLSRWYATQHDPPPEHYKIYREKVRRGLTAASQVVTSTHAALAALNYYYGPFSKGTVIPHGRDPALFQSQTKEPFVLASGRLWDPTKNLGVLKSVAPKISWPISIAGDNPPPAEKTPDMRNIQMKMLGLLNSSQFAQYLARASIFVLPARYDPFGFTPLEAALAGCALVLSDIPTLRETWDKAALFIEPDDPDGIALAINTLIDDPDTLQQYADHASLIAMQFSPQAMARAYIDVYQQIVQPEYMQMQPAEPL